MQSSGIGHTWVTEDWQYVANRIYVWQTCFILFLQYPRYLLMRVVYTLTTKMQMYRYSLILTVSLIPAKAFHISSSTKSMWLKGCYFLVVLLKYWLQQEAAYIIQEGVRNGFAQSVKPSIWKHRDDKSKTHINVLNFFILHTCSHVLWQTVKTQMKCRIRRHLIMVCTVY